MTQYNRVRSISENPVNALFEIEYDGSPYSSMNTLVSSYENSISDVVTPDYLGRIKRGEIINNPCTITGERVESTAGSYSATSTSSGKSYVSVGSGVACEWALSLAPLYSMDTSFPTPTYNIPDLITTAKLQAIANMDPADFNFAEDVGEIRETLRLMENPLRFTKDLSKEFKYAVKKRKRKYYSRSKRGSTEAEHHAKAIADTWLTFRFGFKPLVTTISNLYLALSESDKVRFTRNTSRGSASDSFIDNFSRETGGSYSYHFDFEQVHNISVRAGIIYENKNILYDWRQKFGFRNRDLIRTAWDLTSYSFMFDRMFNIGAGITAFQNISNQSLELLAAWYVIKETNVDKVTFVSRDSGPAFSIAVSPSLISNSKESYIRKVWHPNVWDTVPPVTIGGLVADATKTADLVSLIVSNLRG